MLLKLYKGEIIMTDEVIKNYYNLLDMLSVSIFASKWLNGNKNTHYEQLINLNEFIYHELLKFGVNNIGIVEE